MVKAKAKTTKAKATKKVVATTNPFIDGKVIAENIRKNAEEISANIQKNAEEISANIQANAERISKNINAIMTKNLKA
jgi:predicted ATP-grasp superfamily ATP-dependent carboligase